MAWFGQHLGTTFTGDWWGDLPAPVVAPDGSYRPTAGDYDADAILGLGGRPTIKPEVVEREAERRGVEPEAARVVESVAVAIPAGATEVDASRELLRALEASRIEWRRAYDDLLTWYVGVLREIAALRQAQLDDDNAAILLLLMEH